MVEQARARARAQAQLQELAPIEGGARGLSINMEPELIALKHITFSEAVVFEKSGAISSLWGMAA
ncbi:hypothetical protein [Ancylobacter pratisalsi]|uniref:hypothetical protein n=1 Tax=Ancylobacter pratisalsi TaxID=1745854 RepID=UPI001FEB57C6|nr:hypothetical protein [Ancylobacter pratisalsi]